MEILIFESSIDFFVLCRVHKGKKKKDKNRDKEKRKKVYSKDYSIH